jgi:hypothetical protein
MSLMASLINIVQSLQKASFHKIDLELSGTDILTMTQMKRAFCHNFVWLGPSQSQRLKAMVWTK